MLNGYAVGNVFLIVAVFNPNSTGSAKYPFFENALKKATEYFLKFLFLFESTILPVKNGK